MIPPGKSWRWRIRLLALLSLLVVALLAALGSVDTAVLDLMPPVLLAAVMGVWPYPGADLIARLGARRRGRRRAAPALPRLRSPRRTARGGRLISLSLGGRAPPALAGCA